MSSNDKESKHEDTKEAIELEISNPPGSDETNLVNDNRKWCTCISVSAQKWLIGFFIIIGIAVSWVGATQFAQSSLYSPNFNAPFFTVWFSTVWMIVCYPVYFGPACLFGSKNVKAKEIFRQNEAIFGTKGLTWWSVLKLVGPFCVCWAACNYMYVYALTVISAADVTALFASNTVFIYILSWIWLSETFTPLKLLATACSISGVVVMAYSEGFTSSSAVGVALSLGAAITSALYKVLFKRFVGDANLGQVSLFLTLLAVFDLFCLWPIMIVLYFTGVETWDWSDMPWDYLCGSAALQVVYNFLINFGIAFTYPLFIAVGTVLGIPLNTVVDFIWRDVAFGYIKIIGTVLIIAGFILMLVPPSWQDKVRWPKFMRCQKCCDDNQNDSKEAHQWTEDAQTQTDND
ncbi:solute carrier family 35 member F4-like [Glandiceps talaboti]